MELPAINIAPGQAIEADLTSLIAAADARADMDAVSVQIVNDGAAGSLIGSLNGIDRVTRMTYDVPLRDSGIMRNSTGAYPWRIDDDFSTVVSITNTGETSSEFILQFNYEGGPYVFNPRKLAAGETATFDLRKIRDEQVPDNNGRVLPRTLTSGQARWSIHGANPARLIGRAEMLSVSRRISSSYSCACDCPSGPGDIWMEPGSLSLFVGNIGYFTPREVDYDCSGNPMGPFNPSGYWSIGDASIGSVSNGEVTALGSGQTSVGITVPYEVYVWDGLNCFDMGTGGTGASGDMMVAPSVSVGSVSFTSPNPPVIRSGESATLTVILSASPGSAGAEVTVEASISDASGPVNVTVAESPQTVSISPNQTKPVTFTFTAGAVPSSQTLKGRITVTGLQGTMVVDSPKKSSNDLTVQKFP